MHIVLQDLLANIVDYAGLFPPAQLDLTTAIVQYQQHQTEPQSWMLGRFVLKLSQFEQFQRDVNQPQTVSLILDGDLNDGLDRLKLLFKSVSPSLRIAALEIPPCPLVQLQVILPQLPTEIEIYCEIPWESDWTSYLDVIPRYLVGAKIRAGGLTPAAFPSAIQLSGILLSLAQSDIPFKVTAGLHHPLPTTSPLSTAPNSPLARMHGFLNVAIAAAVAYGQTVTLAELQAILETKALSDFGLTDQEVCWRDYSLNLAEVQKARSQFFRSFGSCSFQEPIDDLRNLSLLN
jgi:hypothetical protein